MSNGINLSLSFMYKSWVMLLGCCFNLVIGLAHAQNHIGQDRVMRFAVIYTEEAPYAYSNETTKYSGIVPKLATALGRELGAKVEFLPTSRKGLEATVIKGQADFSWLAEEWVEKNKNLVFSAPVLKHREFLYSLKPFYSSDKPVDWIKGKSICVHQDYIYPILTPFFNQKIAKPINVSSQGHITDLFLSKKCDLLYTNEYRANWAFKALSSEVEIFRSEQPLKQTYQSFLFNKSWQSEMPKINQAIDKIIHSGELKQIVDSEIQLNQNASK